MTPNKLYNKGFFKSIEAKTYSSAKTILPIVNSLLQPRSIVDVGCGTGIWIETWNKMGVTATIGIDGHHIEETLLKIPAESFIKHDLNTPIILQKRFDLVMSLEVAEHLPFSSAKVFIESLCNLGNIILFSAAIPGQNGRGHINEQYPEFWIQLFKIHDFYPIDIIRQQIWNDDTVDLCYRQNILLFAKVGASFSMDGINTIASNPIQSIVHPGYWEDKLTEISIYRKTLKNPFRLVLYYTQLVSKVIRRIFCRSE